MSNPSTETISPDRLRELIEVYNLQCFRGDTALALEELQRLRHYVATCGGTDNDGRCPMHHLAGVSKDTSEDDAFCGDCGEKLEAVRPGKHQHIGPCPSPGASEQPAEEGSLEWWLQDAASILRANGSISHAQRVGNAIELLRSAGADQTLWCMHVIGPDDLHAAPSREMAEAACGWYTERFKDHPEVRFEVIPWPGSAESHAKNVAQWNTEIMPQLPAKSPPEPCAEPVKGSKAWHEIQGLRGYNARLRIEMDIIDRLLDGTADDDLTSIDMEYWIPVHDRIRALVRKSSPEPSDKSDV